MVAREGLARALDRACVLIAPHRAELPSGQDSMKLYDYAARGRPIVCTPGALGPSAWTAHAGVAEATTPEQFAAAVRAAARERPEASVARREWAAANAWSTRWVHWESAVLGSGSGAQPEPDSAGGARA